MMAMVAKHPPSEMAQLRVMIMVKVRKMKLRIVTLILALMCQLTSTMTLMRGIDVVMSHRYTRPVMVQA